jgi:hypothetical protein
MELALAVDVPARASDHLLPNEFQLSVRESAKIGVSIEVGKPIASRLMAEWKSTLG